MIEVATLRLQHRRERPALGGGMTSTPRRNAEFSSGGVACRAWVYAPDESVARPAPCIVMAHGLGGTRDSSLAPYAERFAMAGFYVVLFDYRCLGSQRRHPAPARVDPAPAAGLGLRDRLRPLHGWCRPVPHRPMGHVAVGRICADGRRQRSAGGRCCRAVSHGRRQGQRAHAAARTRASPASCVSAGRRSSMSRARSSGCLPTMSPSSRRRAGSRP